jgi:hypothetical protein
MDKKYQVFISSTYTDLVEERQAVIQQLLQMDCIPVGMEFFPAANDDQWTLITRVIDDCDYYVLIIGDKYGSLSAEGISYTQKEYEYAISKGIPTVAFLHKNPGKIQRDKTEMDTSLRNKLEIFKTSVQKKHCKFWESPAELGGLVVTSMLNLMKTNPRIGWVKADNVQDENSLKENIELRKRIEKLEGELQSVNRVVSFPDFSSKKNKFTNIKYISKSYTDDYSNEYSYKISWKEIINLVCSELFIGNKISSRLIKIIEDYIISKTYIDGDPPIMEFNLENNSFKVLLAQLVSFNLITQIGTAGLGETYWGLSEQGKNYIISTLIKKNK